MDYWDEYFGEMKYDDDGWFEIPNSDIKAYAPLWDADLLKRLNDLANDEKIEIGEMPYCEIYHNALIYDMFYDIDLELFVVHVVCPECNTKNKEVFNEYG